jgi:hypothetical protein
LQRLVFGAAKGGDHLGPGLPKLRPAAK